MSTLEHDDSIFYFSTDSDKLSIDYTKIKNVSELVRVISEDDPQARDITIPTFQGYSQDDVILHLKALLNSIDTGKSMKDDLFSYSGNDLDIGISKVLAKLDSLIIWLLLTNWLDISSLFQDIVDTLLTHHPSLEDIPKYLNIVATILRNHKTETTFLNNALLTLLNSDTVITDKLTLPIIQQVVDREDLNLYDRYLIAIKYRSYAITPPKDEVDKIIARRLYSLDSKIACDNIKDEIQNVERTRQVVIDCIADYKSAVVLAACSENKSGIQDQLKSETEDQKVEPNYFWLYIQSKHGDKVYAGDVVVNGKVYKIYLESKHLYTIQELEDNQLIRVEGDYIDVNSYQSIYADSQFEIISNWKMETINANLKFMLFQREDTRFRQWLDDRGMLSELEKSMLPIRLEVMSQFSNMVYLKNQIHTLEIDSNNRHDTHISHITSKFKKKSKRVEAELKLFKEILATEESTLRVKLLSTYHAEKAFYETEDGKRLEAARQPLRNKFFEGQTLYAGEVAIFDAFEIVELKDSDITLRALTNEMFHATKVDILDESNTSKVFTQYTVIAAYLRTSSDETFIIFSGRDIPIFKLSSFLNDWHKLYYGSHANNPNSTQKSLVRHFDCTDARQMIKKWQSDHQRFNLVLQPQQHILGYPKIQPKLAISLYSKSKSLDIYQGRPWYKYDAGGNLVLLLPPTV